MIPLRVITDYSLLHSLIKVPDLINFLVEKDIKVCGICDENLSGSIYFYDLCISNGIKPLIGLSIKIGEFEVLIYAKNYDGYKNLIKINSLKQEKLIELDDLEEYLDNVLVILPSASVGLYTWFKDRCKVYFGYINQIEKINVYKYSSDCLYIKEIKTLKQESVDYLKYLDMLRKEVVQEHDEYFDMNMDNTNYDKFINEINIEIPKNNRYIPKYRDNSKEFLRLLASKGLMKRLNGEISKIYQDRLNYELSVIEKMGFVDYFLIVYDYVLYAKKNNILVGPGRGSAAGSLVSFVLGITEIDPIKYNLMFERFLNPERVTMPDIDIDFDALKREEVINYVKRKYGEKNVALGLTYTTLKAKLVLREVGKLLNIRDDLVDKFTKAIKYDKLKDNLRDEVVKKYLTNYKELKEMFRISLELEGLKKNTSVHASGVVISSVELDKIIPVLKDGDNLITGITVDEHLESMGLLKMDFLALKNLTTISNIINNIGKNVLKDIKFNESSVYKLFSDGDTDGIFQFETSLMRNLVSKIKPTCFNDLVASVALGRPGPINEANSYVLRKNGKEKVTYIDNRLKSILEDTYGILIYQEQIIEILGLVGGFKYSEADIIRRAISKKKISIMNEYFEKFINGAISNGYSKEDATKIYELIVRFASYGFNKSHSVAYAMVAYQMAYLKVFYPEYFLIEMLNNNTDKQSSYFAFLKNRGMILIKPDINISKIEFYVKGKNVIMPMWQIKGINREIARKIIDARGNGFIDYFDFVSKTHEFLDSSLIEALIKANALRSLKLNQNTLLNNLESATNYGALNDESGLIKKPVIIEYPEFSDSILRSNELNAYGYYLSNHPSSNFKCFKIGDINKYLFKNVKCVVLVERINKIKTKKGDDMAFIRASDESGSCDFTVFPEKFKLLDSLKENDLIEISGSVSKRFDKVSIIVNNIMKEGTHE